MEGYRRGELVFDDVFSDTFRIKRKRSGPARTAGRLTTGRQSAGVRVFARLTIPAAGVSRHPPSSTPRPVA
jgi:hypothetical protein